MVVMPTGVVLRGGCSEYNAGESFALFLSNPTLEADGVADD